MAHNINAFISKSAAWHGLGDITGTYQTIDEVLRHPGFQFVVFKSQLRDGLGRPVDAFGTFRWNLADKLAGRKEAAEFIAPVGKDYTVIQHDEGFKTLDAIMRSADRSFVETAGVLGKGETVWMLVDLGFEAKIGDDVQKGYLLFSTGHDGKTAHSYRIVFLRVVCQNTLSIALSRSTTASFTVRHTKNASLKLDDARAALAAMGDDVKRVEDRLNFLANRKMNREALDVIFNRLFPKNEEAKSTTRRDNILSDILKLYEANDGNAFPEQRGTAYSLLNAITDYADHQRSTKDDGRAEAAMFGSGDALKTKAYEVIYQMAPGMETRTRGTAGIEMDFASLGLNVPGAVAQ